ncbi:uncharacterized protein LOC126672606 [Mercurialis annua]|uniref:uncharacterized protein LOC126672606 n=1 Tax=Mercurialis annua TaxID=3986 RepID=UPI00215F463C|nr:uncharacterized protein LOC126672606 [Mercurialis annua]
MEETHGTIYSVHLGSTKMYHDIKGMYWWSGMKKDIAEFVAKCPTYFRGRWDTYLPLVEFAYNNNYLSSIEMAPYEALYGRKCRSPICRDEVGERKLAGAEIIQITSEKVPLIKQRLNTAFSRQKSYADPKRKDIEFQIEDYVFLKFNTTIANKEDSDGESFLEKSVYRRIHVGNRGGYEAEIFVLIYSRLGCYLDVG